MNFSWGNDEPEPPRPANPGWHLPTADLGGVTLYMPPDEPADPSTAGEALRSLVATWGSRKPTFDIPVRYEPLPAWARAPPAPSVFGSTAAVELPFELGWVRSYRSMGADTKAEVQQYMHRRLWDFYPYVEDRRAFAMSHTFGMAPSVLFGVGPVGYRRFGTAQAQPRKMYFSSPSAYRSWLSQHYEPEESVTDG